VANTETSICNSALIKLGAQTILSLDGQDKISRMMKEQYPKNRDAVLYAHPWKFATRTITPAEVVQDPASPMPNKFQLPADCLRVLITDNNDDQWTTEDGFLYVNRNDVTIKYIYRCEDVGKYTPGFVEMLACKIAADVAYAIVQSVTLRQQMIQEYDKQLAFVRSFSAQEGSAKRVYADSWLHSRL